jgi:regulator of sirC expression with transglutaminase-like and TPR domain
MLAGVGCLAGVCLPAKPQWSEVMIFLELLLRQWGFSPEKKIICFLKKDNRAFVF